MGVYVPRMKMPECCLLCPFEHMMTCSREERYTDIHERQRPEWCPLIEIQEAEKEYKFENITFSIEDLIRNMEINGIRRVRLYGKAALLPADQEELERDE